MNKFEKLIEYIINDEDQKARELFHSIVVEKSRDIYESIMDEEQMQEKVHGDQVGDMVDEIDSEESMHEADGEEFGTDDDMGDDDMGDDDMGDDDMGDDDMDHEESDAEAHGEIEDQVMSIDSKLDELLAKFDEIMGGEEHGMEAPEMGADMGAEPEMDHEMSAEPEMEEMGMMEGEQPEWLKKGSGKSGSGSAASGKSGSAKMEAAKAGSAVSGKSGSAKSGTSGKSGSGKTEGRKSAAEMMREYVEKIEDINLTPGTYSEGEPVGAGQGTKKVAVNNKSISLDKGPDFGGTSENIITKKGNTNEVPDGKSIPKPKSPYDTSAPQEHPVAKKNVNVPGGNAGKSGFKNSEPAYKDGGDGQNKESGKKVGSAKDGSVSINKKSELGQAGQPTGKKI